MNKILLKIRLFYPKKLIVSLFLMISTLFVFATDWEISEQNSNITTIINSQGKKALIISTQILLDENLQKIYNVLDTIWAISELQGTQASIKIESNARFHLVIYPTELTVNSVSLLPYIPSGLSFYYDNSLFYDVSLKVNDMMPKVKGAYIDSTDFLEQLLLATKMPEWFMSDTHLQNRIALLEKTLIAILNKNWSGKPVPVADEIIKKIIGYYGENPLITEEETLQKLKSEGYQTNLKEIKAVFIVYFGIIND